MTTCAIHSRINPQIKAEATKIFEQLGLTMSDAIRLFSQQAVAEKKIPFSIDSPNAKTLAAVEEAKDLKRLHKTSLEQLKKDWKAVCEK